MRNALAPFFFVFAPMAFSILMMLALRAKERLAERWSTETSDPGLEDLLRQLPGPPDERAGTSWSLRGAKVKRLGPNVLMATGVVDGTLRANVAYFFFCVYALMMLTAFPPAMCLAALGMVLFASWPRRTWFVDAERGLLTLETSWPWLGSKVVSEQPLADFVVRRTLETVTLGGCEEHYAKVWLIRGEQRHRVLRVLVDPVAPKSRKAQRAWRTYRHVSDLIGELVSRAAQRDTSRSQDAASARADGRRTGEMSARPLKLRSPPWHPRFVRQEDWRAAVLVACAVSLFAHGWPFAPRLVDALVAAAGTGTAITFAASYLRRRFGEHVTCLLDRDRERLRIERRLPFRPPEVEERSLFHLEDARLVRRGGVYDVVLVLRSGEELPLFRGEDLESAHRGGVVEEVREFLTGGEPGKPSIAAARRGTATEGRHAATPPPGGKTGPANTPGPAPTTS